ncbi:protein PERCC1 [Odontesthes bonariensis]|uniref:protein PERCC1 n=1 Tax=Odontesthes bonariensis TaxID=219752 RepID=UPI003F58A527
MAAEVIRNFLIQAPTPSYYPIIFQHSPCKEDEEEELEEKSEGRADGEEREEEEEDEDCEAQEDEEECLDGFLLNPSHAALDVTKQLLRFADLISRDVQRYFGRCSDDREGCDIYSDSVSMTTGGRLRYYDDLLRIARAGSPEEQENSLLAHADDPAVTVAKDNGSLGPLAELFDHRGLSQGRGQPMIKRHLPLSFWTEPLPHCALISFSNTPGVSHADGSAASQDGTHTNGNRHVHFNPIAHHNTHTLESTQLDFSDLLADWDPNPEFNHTLTEDTHMQH